MQDRSGLWRDTLLWNTIPQIPYLDESKPFEVSFALFREKPNHVTLR